MTVSPDLRFFFMHIMKTGGATFGQHVLNNFSPDEVYPVRKHDPRTVRPKYNVEYLLSLPAERRDRIRAYTGHFPLVVAELLDVPLVTLTILRDPIARTISYLKQLRDTRHGASLEELYEDPWQFPMLIQNHQTKLFAFTVDDAPASYMEVLEIDDGRYELATRNLETVDVLGLQEHYHEFLEVMSTRYGWTIGDIPDWHVSAEERVPGSFRRRIAEDNAYDMAFYDHARQLYAARRRAD